MTGLLFSLWIHAFAGAAPAVPAKMRLKDGTTYQLHQPPQLKSGRFVFTTTEGKVFSLSETEVEEIELLAPAAAARPAPNPEDSRQLGAIARQQRRQKGRYTLIAPAPTPRPKRIAAR